MRLIGRASIWVRRTLIRQCDYSSTLRSSPTTRRWLMAQNENNLRQDTEHDRLETEASAMTRSMYRTCLRSVFQIRHGNAHDEADFVAREQERLDAMNPKSDINSASGSSSGKVGSFMSLLPPVDRQDELRSRSEYYWQYLRENVTQEADILRPRPWQRQQVARYLHQLRQGYRQRAWLLQDMKFAETQAPPPLDASRVGEWETSAFALADVTEKEKRPTHHSNSNPTNEGQQFVSAHGVDNADDDYDSDDDESDDATSGGLPSWYRNPRSNS